MSTADPDKLVALEAEQKFLFMSLADLDAEQAAGDISAEDYLQLKNAYTVRSAAVITELEVARGGGEVSEQVEGKSLWQRLSVVAGLGLFVLVAGYVLAQAVGERGINDELSGEIDRTPREMVLDCQALGPMRVQESLECYQDVLDIDPLNVEAHTYRGWALVLVVGSAQQDGIDVSEDLMPQAWFHFDRAVEIDPRFPDVRAFRAVALEGEGDVAGACEEVRTLGTLNPAPFIVELTTPLRERLGC